MAQPSRSLFGPLPLFAAMLLTSTAHAQISAPTDTTVRSYLANGVTDQPFTIQVVGCRRTVANVLLIKLVLTNLGTNPIQPQQDFAGNNNPTDLNRISAFYAEDPNGRKKYTVLRNAQNEPLCSAVVPPIQPGEKRNVFAEFTAPPQTSSVVDLYFPKANPILSVPMGLSQAGEPIIPEADVAPSGLPTPAGAVPVGPSTDITEGANNSEPNLYTNQTNPVPSGSPLKGIGNVTSANSTVPFTVDVLKLTAPASGPATLQLAVTNNGSGNLDATGQFSGAVVDGADAQTIAGVYMVDPVSKQRFDVVRDGQGHIGAAKIDPAFGPGERRVLQAQFPAIPATVKSVYVYFPHATPISDVPVSRVSGK